MNQGMRPFLLRWLCTTLAVAVAVALTGMESAGWLPLILTALLLGIINAFLRPVLLLLSVPFIILTLGLFIFVVNAALLGLAGGLVPGFAVNGFWNAFFGAIIVTIVNGGLSLFFKGDDGRYHVITQPGGMKQVQGRVVGEGEGK